MNAWRWLGASFLVVALSLTLSASAQEKGKDDKDKKGDDKKGQVDKKPAGEPITIKWTAFDSKDSKPFYQEMSTTTDQTMRVMGMEVKQKQSQTFYIQWTPVKSDDSSWTVKQTIIGVKMDIEIGGNKISFDSTAEQQPPNPLTDFFRALVDAEFTLTINKKTLAVTEIAGRTEFIAKLTKTNAQLDSLLKAILSDKALKQMADPIFAVVPEKAVTVGETWTKKSTLDMGPIGTYETEYKYTLKGVEKDLATIDVATSLNYKAPTGGTEGLPFKIISATLKSKDKEGTGKVVFDMKAGRIQQSDLTLVLNGDLNIEIAGMQTPVTLEQTQKSNLKTSDERPIKAKKQ
jgi:hypothetical protein